METPTTSGSAPGSPGSPDEILGLREQAGRLRDAVVALLRAHVDLLRAELGDIFDRLKQIAGLVGVIIAAIFWAAVLLAVGLPLFLGEWLFGSIGWGVLHGTLFAIDITVAAGILALGARPRVVGWAVVFGVLGGIVVGVALASVLPSVPQAAAALGLAAGLLVWLAGMGWVAARGGLEPAARFRRLTPQASIDSARETIEWVRGRIRPASR